MDIVSKITSCLTNLDLTFILHPEIQRFGPISATTPESHQLWNDLKSQSKYFFRSDSNFSISSSRICCIFYNAQTQRN